MKELTPEKEKTGASTDTSEKRGISRNKKEISNDETVYEKRPISRRKGRRPKNVYEDITNIPEEDLPVDIELKNTEYKRRPPVLNPRIKTWKAKDKDELFSFDGKVMIVHFEKVFPEKYAIFDMFQITKSSYEHKLPMMVHYMNYFEKFYDQDHELMTAFLKIKYALEKERKFGAEDIDGYKEYIYDVIFRPPLIEKIERMCVENYLDDIEEESEDKLKYMKNEQSHLESLRFTNQHIRILLAISFGMKILSPPMFHYFAFNNIHIDKKDLTYYNFYVGCFDIFKQDCDIYNKMYVYVKTKVLESYSNNSIIFSQREIFGTDIYTIVDEFIKVQFITDNMVKYAFSETWDPKTGHYKENIPGFNKTVLKYQIHYFLKDQHTFNLTEVTNTKNSDGLSGSDKMQANLTKIDESIPIQADINIRETCKYIQRQMDIEITEEEIRYYRENQQPSKVQMQLVRSFFAKYFDSYNELKLLNGRQYVTLSLILKKKLLLDGGCNQKTNKPVASALPYILTGNVIDNNVNTRLVRNNKFMDKISSDYIWQKLIDEKYVHLNEISPNYIMELISTFINTRFSFVTYECPEITGKEIIYSDDKIADELLFFFQSI